MEKTESKDSVISDKQSKLLNAYNRHKIHQKLINREMNLGNHKSPNLNISFKFEQNLNKSFNQTRLKVLLFKTG